MRHRAGERGRRVARAFGEVLRQLRRERRFPQERLAGMAECHRTNITLLERGLQNPLATVRLAIRAPERIPGPAAEAWPAPPPTPL
jgi:DNA-binding XRE family transcriptional regulator